MGYRVVCYSLFLLCWSLLSFAKSEKRILIGLDGIGKDILDVAKERGMFKRFKNISTHISTFPSISDYAWNTLTQARMVNGPQGRIKHYEAAHFDEEHQSTSNDVRDWFRRLANPMLYSAAFEHRLNPFIEGTVYFSKGEVVNAEFEQLEEKLKEELYKPFSSVFIATLDGVAHTHIDKLYYHLKNLDDMIERVYSFYKGAGINAKIQIVSDHGQAKRFQEGEKENYLLPISIADHLQEIDLQLVSQLKNEDDIAAPQMALANYIGLHFQSLKKRSLVIESLKRSEWFDLSVHIISRKNNGELQVEVNSTDGTALITYNPRKGKKLSQYEYIVKKGNPLHVKHGQFSGNQDQALAVTLETPYPDSIFRIIEAAKQKEASFPDLIITAKDQYYFSSTHASGVKMVRTHGSLSWNSSAGIAMTNSSELLPAFMRTKDVLRSFNLKASQLFHHHKPSTSETQQNIAHPDYQGIETRAGDFNETLIFRRMVKGLVESKYLFNMNTIESLSKYSSSMELNSGSGRALPLTTSKIDPYDIGTFVDLLLQHRNIETLTKDPHFQQLKEKWSRKHLTEENANKILSDELPEKGDFFRYTYAAKIVAMKTYSLPSFLQRLFTIPELSFLEDDRDLAFSHNFFNQKNIEDEQDIKTLFQEIFKEKKLESYISPVMMPLLYQANFPNDLTIVYLPGIYDSIFDGEIFQKALDQLKFKWGLRVIRPPTQSSCSSAYNGPLIMDFLQRDARQQESKGRAKQNYFLLGYSKGAIDALYAFLENEVFVKRSIIGLMAISSPLQGTSLATKAALNFQLVDALSLEKTPKICQINENAIQSLRPGHMKKFWKLHGQKLMELTNYFSVSMASRPYNSHLWMQITKQLALFNEPNDGVVPVSASIFPKYMHAPHFGVVEGDHLAGIASSPFPQSAFIQSLLLSVHHLNFFNRNFAHSYRRKFLRRSDSTSPDWHYKRAVNILKLASPFYFRINNFLKTRVLSELSKQELDKLSGHINKRLKNSQYRHKKIYLRKVINIDGSFKVIMVWDADYWFTGRERQEVTSIEQIIKLILTHTQINKRNYYKFENKNKNFPISERAPFKFPAGESLKFDVDRKIDSMKLESILSKNHFPVLNKSSSPQGINIIYDHQSSQEFRQEYRFAYESWAPDGADENSKNGWESILLEDGVAGRMRSQNESIRMTSLYLRFSPLEFPEIELKVLVNNDVKGAQTEKGENGKDDAAFRVGFTVRHIGKNKQEILDDEKPNVMTFGYFVASSSQQHLTTGKVYESYFSKKKLLGVITLPEQKHIPIAIFSPKIKGKMQTYKMNLLEDLARAFPNIPANELQVISVSLHMDSNHTADDSEAIFKSLRIVP